MKMDKGRIKLLKKFSLLTPLIIGALISGIVANEAAKKRDFKGRAEFFFYRKAGAGRWEVFDKWVAPNLGFKVSVTDIATGKEFTSEGIWEGQSEKGHRISLRLSRAGTAQVSLGDGSVRVVVPFDITIDGRKLRESFTATSGTTDGPTGPISGQRAIFDAAEHTLKINVVGSKPIPLPTEILDGTSNTRSASDLTTVLVVARLEGAFKKAD
jgi:hypothetical protein